MPEIWKSAWQRRGAKPATSRGSRARTILAAVVIWLLLIGAGMGLLWRHTLTPGEAAQAPNDWPSGSFPAPGPERTTLVMWCHPHCPCTPASLGGLSRLAAKAGDRLDVRVYFYRPKGFTDQWVRGENWRLANAIPGARVLLDNGEQARRFGVNTSGQTLIFGKNSRLYFSGGLTVGRGHLGESEGLEAAIRTVLADEPKYWQGPVYGCSLIGESAADALEQQIPDEWMANRSQEARS